jgi:(p)ppGpp synthase/HD superfamily hydrolase
MKLYQNTMLFGNKNKMNLLVKTARDFAIKYHGDQMYGNKPYIYHLEQVAEILKYHSDILLILAYLHDVIEDTTIVSREEIERLIEEQFGAFILECILVLTDEHGENRKERKQKTYAKMALVNDKRIVALNTKGADRLSNVRECILTGNTKLLNMYKSEHKQFMKSVYRPNQAESIFEELNKLLG